MAKKTFTLKKYNGTSYDILYPETTIEQVDNLQTALDSKQDDLTATSTDKDKFLHSNSSTGSPEWVQVDKNTVGLGNVDNTSDATKKSSFTGSIASGNTGFTTGGDVYTGLAGKQNTIVFSDTQPTGQSFGDFWIKDTTLLPSELTRMNSIYVNNPWHSGINTGLRYDNTGVHLHLKLNFNDVSNYGHQLIFCVNDYRIHLISGNLLYRSYSDIVKSGLVTGVDYTLDYYCTKDFRKLYLDDELIVNDTSVLSSLPWYNYLIPQAGGETTTSSNVGEKYFRFKLKETKVYNYDGTNETLVFDGIPVQSNASVTAYHGTNELTPIEVPTGKAGLYDTVSKRFFIVAGNEGGGTWDFNPYVAD